MATKKNNKRKHNFRKRGANPRKLEIHRAIYPIEKDIIFVISYGPVHKCIFAREHDKCNQGDWNNTFL